MPKTLLSSDWISGRLVFTGTVPAGNFGDDTGLFEIDMVMTGTQAGHVAGFCSSISIPSGTLLGGNHVTPIATIIREITGTTVTNSILIFGMHMTAWLDDTSGWQSLCPFFLNTANQSITALFAVASGPAIGLVNGTPSATATGSIPICCNPDGSSVRWIRVYSSSS